MYSSHKPALYSEYLTACRFTDCRTQTRSRWSWGRDGSASRSSPTGSFSTTSKRACSVREGCVCGGDWIVWRCVCGLLECVTLCVWVIAVCDAVCVGYWSVWRCVCGWLECVTLMCVCAGSSWTTLSRTWSGTWRRARSCGTLWRERCAPSVWTASWVALASSPGTTRSSRSVVAIMTYYYYYFLTIIIMTY